MDFDDLDPIDILAFATDELRGRFANAKDKATQKEVVEEFLQNWDSDPALKKLKQLKVSFEKDLDWFNVNHPLTAGDLHGKLVILDFFTYCCINCMHVFPELKAVEDSFSIEDGLVVVGVHSPKFENEKDSANICSAIQRYNITHPIVNDPSSSLWNKLHIKCWPTLLLLSPTGAPILLLMGEGHKEFLEKFVQQALEYFSNKKQLQHFNIPLSNSSNSIPASNLKFPSKIARFQRSTGDDIFAIADSGNNRILIIDEHGVVLHRIGGCDIGFSNGNFESARFHAPQGVAFVSEDELVVADTENHAIRQIVLSSGEVKTLAGTGSQGADRVGGKVGKVQEISSPWDVAVFKTRDMDMSFHIDEKKIPEKTVILIAMAGTHQIWGYFPEGAIWWKFKTFEPLVCASLIGNGLEENRNNSYPQNAAFAQPSGLAMAREFLFIADSESSSVRKASMVDGKVMAVVGGDRNPLNLFAFGDVDGKQYNAKLQHPLGVAFNENNNKIYVADTYNHKIKSINIDTNTVETCIIKDVQSKTYTFNEPAGLCCDSNGRHLLVSDTNNHRILIVDLQTMQMKPFNLHFENINNSQNNAVSSAKTIELRRNICLSGCKNVSIQINLALEDRFKFTKDAPQKWSCNAVKFSLCQENLKNEELQHGKLNLQLRRVENEVDAVDANREEEIKLNFSLNLCDDKTCVMKKFSVILTNSIGEKQSNESIVEQLNLNVTKNDVKLS